MGECVLYNVFVFERVGGSRRLMVCWVPGGMHCKRGGSNLDRRPNLISFFSLFILLLLCTTNQSAITVWAGVKAASCLSCEGKRRRKESVYTVQERARFFSRILQLTYIGAVFMIKQEKRVRLHYIGACKICLHIVQLTLELQVAFPVMGNVGEKSQFTL